MSAAVQPFDFNGDEVRVRMESDEVIFVAADVAPILGYSDTASMTRYLDADEKGLSIWQTPGGNQRMSHVTEEGLYAAIMRATSDQSRPFRRWVTHEVLPTIRRTGSYGQPTGMSFEEMTSHVIGELSRRIEEAQERARELEAPARAWTGLSSADGDFTVSDAAKALARGGVETGPRKLYDWLKDNGWVFRRGGRWQAMQSAVNAGLIVERITSGYFDQVSGERKHGDPQIRITAKGLERLLDLTRQQAELAVIEGGA